MGDISEFKDTSGEVYSLKDKIARSQKMKGLSDTLLASGWEGSSVPYSYDLGPDYTGKNISVGFDGTTGTAEQLEAAKKANLQGGDGTIIYAFDNKPTTDIPVIIQYE